MTELSIDLQNACDADWLPESRQIRYWAELAIKTASQKANNPVAEACKDSADSMTDVTDASTTSTTATLRPLSLGIRIVGLDEMAQLNQRYRGRDGATNVLSFEFETPDCADDPDQPRLLGDIVICSEVLTQEALEQKKEILSHWAHIVMHGVLHLLGYDHETEVQAHAMETLEAELLTKLGYENPYMPPEQLLGQGA